MTEKSTSVFVFMLEFFPYVGKVRNNTLFFLSSAEFEYRGAVNATTQCVWVQDILQELDVALDSPTVIWCNNKSAINIYIDPIQRQRTKNIEIHMHYIRGLVHD